MWHMLGAAVKNIIALYKQMIELRLNSLPSELLAFQTAQDFYKPEKRTANNFLLSLPDGLLRGNNFLC